MTPYSPRNSRKVYSHQCGDSRDLEAQGCEEGVRQRAEDKDWPLGKREEWSKLGEHSAVRPADMYGALTVPGTRRNFTHTH